MTRRQGHRQRGQGTVEFVLVSLFLGFFLMLVWQLSWVATQKWYFSFTSAYAARAWSVQPGRWMTPQMSLLKTMGLARAHHEVLRERMPIIRVVDAGFYKPFGMLDLRMRYDTFWTPPGIEFRGVGTLFGMFKPRAIEGAGLESRGNGTVLFSTYIPIRHEESYDGSENPRRYDNDR